MLAAMAQLTTRTRIGCAVVGNTYRHPAVLAKMAVTVDHLSGGRLEFGIGAGWAENEHTMLGLEFGTQERPRRPARGERPDHPGAVDAAAHHVRGQALPAAATPSPSPSRCSSHTRRSGSAARGPSGRCGSPRSMRTCGTRPVAARRRSPRPRRSSTSTAPTSGGTRARSGDRCSSGSATTTLDQVRATTEALRQGRRHRLPADRAAATTRWPSGNGSRPSSRGCASSADGRRGSMTGQSALTVSAAPSTLSGRPVTLPVNLRCRTGG